MGLGVRLSGAEADLPDLLHAGHGALRAGPVRGQNRELGAVRAHLRRDPHHVRWGFATIPAYLADIFGTQFVGAIHGRILTAWSAAGILGPVLVNYIRDYQLDHGVPAAQVYNATMYLLAGLLVVGFFCNLAVRPVAEEHYMSEEELAQERAPAAAGAR